ncbi:MAG: hypothetical protein ACRD1H_12645, partial [Vicinamibacterales bacterium]
MAADVGFRYAVIQMPRWTVFVRQNVDRHVLAGALLGGVVVPAQSASESSLAAYLAGAAGLIAVHERLRSEFPRSVSLTTTLVIFGGTSLFWSMTRAASFVEAGSFGLVAALALVSARLRLGGAVVWFLLAAAAPLALRSVAGGSVDGTALSVSTDWLSHLFSSSHGFLALTPVAYVALVGTVAYLRRNFFWAASALAVLAIWLAVNALVPGGRVADGPTGHGLTAALATLAPGLAFLIDRARVRPVLAVVPLVAVALLWNYWLMVQYTVGTLPKDAPVSFADMVRQQAAAHTRSPYVYLFAFPGNAWFAWREGVPADRYE